MKKYQIRLLRSDGCGHNLYFDALEEDAVAKACDIANAHLNQIRSRADFFSNSIFRRQYKPVKTAFVVEYISQLGCAKRDGHKFKLELSFIEIGFTNGNKARDEWYQEKK